MIQTHKSSQDFAADVVVDVSYMNCYFRFSHIPHVSEVLLQLILNASRSTLKMWQADVERITQSLKCGKMVSIVSKGGCFRCQAMAFDVLNKCKRVECKHHSSMASKFISSDRYWKGLLRITLI